MKNVIMAIVFLAGALGAESRADNPPPTADVAILKQKIAPVRARIEAGTKRARAMTLILRGPKNEISYDQCKGLQKNIEAQYPLSPFYAVYDDGSSFSQLCDWNTEYPSKEDSVRSGMKYYLDTAAAKNQFGIPGAYVFKVSNPHPQGFGRNFPEESEFLLDGQFRVLERTNRVIDPDGKSIEWAVSSLSPEGDNYVYMGLGDSGLIKGITERAFFASGDGELWGVWVKRPRRSDHGNEIVIDQTFEYDHKDWKQFSLIITHFLGRYYQYTPGHWTTRTNVADSLFEISLADTGKEVCADGSSHNGEQNWTDYKPSDPKEPWTCDNSW